MCHLSDVLRSIYPYATLETPFICSGVPRYSGYRQEASFLLGVASTLAGADKKLQGLFEHPQQGPPMPTSESRVPAMTWAGTGEMVPTLYHQPYWRLVGTLQLSHEALPQQTRMPMCSVAVDDLQDPFQVTYRGPYSQVFQGLRTYYPLQSTSRYYCGVLPPLSLETECSSGDS